MKIRKATYKLTKLALEDYLEVVRILHKDSLFNSYWRNEGEKYGTHHFLMPGAKVSLDLTILKDPKVSQETIVHQDVPLLYVAHTSFFEPGYVRRMVRNLGGERLVSYDIPEFDFQGRDPHLKGQPDKEIAEYLAIKKETEAYHGFCRKNVRSA